MFSIVIPTKNEEENLAKLLESIEQQDLKPDKVVVADDSKDKTREVAKKYGAEVVQGTSDGRIGLARNNGAKAVDSKLILFLDADVVLPPKFLRKFVYTFIADDLDIATSYLEIERKKLRSLFYYGSYNAMKSLGSATKFVTSESGACMIVKKEVFDKAGGFLEHMRVGEDSNLIRRIIKMGGKYKVLSVKVKTSTRRVDRSIIKFAGIFVGIGGLVLLSKFGGKGVDKAKRLFERMYGETGGKLKSPK